MTGKFVVVDGLDGAGKGVVISALGSWASSRGLKVLDLRGAQDIPEFKTLDADVILSAEPTFSLVGRAIREELIKNNGRDYSSKTVANAFALDREILFRRLVIPAIQAGKYVFQERGLVSSLVYQPVQNKLSLKYLLDLPGNKLSVETAPNLLLILDVDPKVSMDRLGLREKKDDSIFENLAFQKKIRRRYRSDWLKKLFESHGTRVVYLDTTKSSKQETEKAALDIFAGV